MQVKEDVRTDVRELLEGGHAHVSFDDAVRDIPTELRGWRPPGLPYSPWELLEHMRIAQHDILEFIRDPDYESPAWPEGYWPTGQAPPDHAAWDRSVRAFRADRKAILKLVEDHSVDLARPIAHGTGQTLLREALLAADHTAYHLGQLVVVRRLLGNWE